MSNTACCHPGSSLSDLSLLVLYSEARALTLAAQHQASGRSSLSRSAAGSVSESDAGGNLGASSSRNCWPPPPPPPPCWADTVSATCRDEQLAPQADSSITHFAAAVGKSNGSSRRIWKRLSMQRCRSTWWDSVITLNSQGRRQKGHRCSSWVARHLLMHCKWNAWPQVPHTTGASSPGTCNLGIVSACTRVRIGALQCVTAGAPHHKHVVPWHLRMRTCNIRGFGTHHIPHLGTQTPAVAAYARHPLCHRKRVEASQPHMALR